MIKKTLLGAAVVAVVGSFVFGREVLSYARTCGESVRHAVKQEVPLSFEVERARKMIERIVPDIRQHMHVIAEQQVDIEELGREIARRETSVADQEHALLALRSDLQTGQSTFRYASRTYTSDEVRRDLAKRLARLNMTNEILDRERQILRAREKALVSNQEKLEGMLAAKKDLEVQVEQLEARLKAIEAAETVSSLELDHSQLNRAKKLIRELNKQLDVKEKLLDAEGQFQGLIPVETDSLDVPSDIEEQVDAYFGRNNLPEVAESNETPSGI